MGASPVSVLAWSGWTPTRECVGEVRQGIEAGAGRDRGRGLSQERCSQVDPVSLGALDLQGYETEVLGEDQAAGEQACGSTLTVGSNKSQSYVATKSRGCIAPRW
jgi:hypothetical protein